MTNEQMAKLPKWARDHIAGLERRLEMSEAANARFLGGMGQPVKSRLSAEESGALYGRPEYYSRPLIEVGYVVPLAFPVDRPHLTLSGLPDLAAFEAARAARQSVAHFDIRQDEDGSLRVSGSDSSLSIEPHSTNVAILRLKR